jgi:hypothetical protein
MPWYIWIPFAGLGVLSVACFARSYAHIRPELQGQAHRLTLRGSLIPQSLFTDRGSQLRVLGWIWACCAIGVVIVWGLIEN